MRFYPNSTITNVINIDFCLGNKKRDSSKRVYKSEDWEKYNMGSWEIWKINNRKMETF